MKTKVLVSMLLIASLQLVSAQKYLSKNGHVWFYSHTPMENVEAHNNQVVSVIDASTGDIKFNLLQKAFEFKVALMQEHFNENYMESEKFPKASFSGKITNLSTINFKKAGVYSAEVTGELSMHGITKTITTKGTIEVKGTSIIAVSKFTIAPKDFGIVIPQLVENKIAKEMEVNVDITYNPM